MTIYTDVRDRPLLLSQFLHHKKSLGRFTKSFKEFKYLDMVDCSNLEHSTNWKYHTYFFINMTIIGDMRDIITTQKRAKLRNERLVPKHTRDNSYQFKSVPTGLAFSG